MRIVVTEDVEKRESIRKSLKLNNFYCPSIQNSKNKKEYHCICQDFIEKTPKGQYCRCGLYYKESDD